MQPTTSPSRDAWLGALAELRTQEKAHTRAQDALAAARRRLPRLKVERSYRFEGPDGPVDLDGLFDGRRQLIVYHHMLKAADPTPCPGCCMVADNIGHLAHLHARDITLALVSQAPFGEIDAFRKKMGWQMPWYATADSFNPDFDVTGDGFGLNVFLRDDATIYRTYFTNGRGVEMLGSTWSFLDISPFGRQETWEDAPAGTPQSAPYQWWRRHDDYADATRSGSCCD